MKKILMTVEYNGANFHGWQKQKNKRTVQGELEEKIKILTGDEVKVEGSGRTDKGVHALGQVATVNIEKNIPLSNFKTALNKLLSDDVCVKSVKFASSDFHPRFNAKRKTYRYVVSNKRSALEHDLVTYYPYKVDVERMKKASELFLGKHNFKAFCASGATVKDFEREIYGLKITERECKIIFEITGNGFLYNMVRIIVGTLLEIEKIGEENILKAFKEGDRSLVGKTMAPNGLYLKKVEYI